MERDRKAQLMEELQSLQKPYWSYKDAMTFFHCGSARAVAMIKRARANEGKAPYERHKALTDVILNMETSCTTSREREIDNRVAELYGARPSQKEESHA